MDQTDASKTCTKCGETKPLDEFYSGRKKCKKCTLEERKAAYAGSTQVRARKIDAAAKRYKFLKWTPKLKKQRAIASAKYRDKHPDRVAAYQDRHKEQAAERLRKWREENKEKLHAQSLRRRPKQAAYYKKHMEYLSDMYIRNNFRVPVEFVELKRTQLQIHRATMQTKQILKEKTNG